MGYFGETKKYQQYARDLATLALRDRIVGRDQADQYIAENRQSISEDDLDLFCIIHDGKIINALDAGTHPWDVAQEITMDHIRAAADHHV